MTFPASHKTVFTLDHTLSSSSGVKFDLESLSKGKNNANSLQPSNIPVIPLLPVTKSMWTCAVEALTEYCRIVWDIFPSTRLIRFISVDKTVRRLNRWNPDEQNFASLTNLFMNLGPAKSGIKVDMDSGLKAALEALMEPTAIQQEKRSSLAENAARVLNKGRVIVFTKFDSETEVKSIQERFHDLLLQENKVAAATDTLMPINHCDLVLVNFCKEGVNLSFENKMWHDYSTLLSCELFNINCGVSLAPKLCNLVLRHYELASTTVTGIPMKEEQNASSSANYDVELFHPAAAHMAILKGIPSETTHLRTVREGTDYETITLKWCTPRSNASMELQHCSSAYRITSVDVNSRPSSCLTNFLLNGRWVMLEMPRKAGGKVISHMLACHGGDIFIHTMYTARSVLEDPPSISEGVGGRVADYRIPHFGDLIRSNLLAPHPNVILEEGEEGALPLDLSKDLLKRQTRIWPITLSSTYLFSLGQTIAPLANLMVKEIMTEDEVIECKNVMFTLMNMEARSESLPASSSSQRGTKGIGKREEQYKSLWMELEQFIRFHLDSPEHEKVLECLLECQNKNEGLKESNNEDKMDFDQALMEIETTTSKDKLSAKGKAVVNSSEVMSSESKKRKGIHLPLATIGKKSSMSLLSLWESKINSEQSQRCPEFQGRINSNDNFTPLYPNFQKDKEKEEQPQRKK